MNIRNYKLTNACIVVHTTKFPEFNDDSKFFEYLENLPYLVGKKEEYFFIFQREMNAEGEHWQIYIELNKQQYFTVLQRNFRSANIKPRNKTQEQAIKYCKKKETRLSGPYEKGIPKRISRTKSLNGRNEEWKGESSHQQKIVNIINKISSNKYNDFFEIEKENPDFFITNKATLKNIWNRYNPVSFWDVRPAKVLWIYGERGSGKTVWTEKYLRDSNYRIEEITTIFPNSITYNDKIVFDIDDEKGRVLVINEVGEEFPKNNNLIMFIDRRGLLEARESKIKNNFELIIINSLYRPEEVFGYLGKRAAGQVLRRIFSPFFDCQVYQINSNEQQLDELLNSRKKLSNKEFQNWYKPTVQKIPEPNYSLIEKD